MMKSKNTDNTIDINNLCSPKLLEILTINQRLDRLQQEIIEQELMKLGKSYFFNVIKKILLGKHMYT